jgi:hypothetical protein
MSTELRIRRAARALEKRLEACPFLVANEAEFQAELQVELLNEFPEEVELTLGPGVVDRRPSKPLKARRVYREAKIRPGQAGQEPDIVILGVGRQTLLAKENGAPSRFACPYEAIIETKMDASPTQVLASHPGKPLASKIIQADLAKWDVPAEAKVCLSIIYTARPEWYAPRPDVIALRRPLVGRPAGLPSTTAIKGAISAYAASVAEIHAEFAAHPFRFLREKDFETQLLHRMRLRVPVRADELHPVRCQWWSEHSGVLGRKRRHDLVVLAKEPGRLALEVELKTSHSDQHNWYRTSALKGEFDAMHQLKAHGTLARAVFLMFRFGPDRWQSDAQSLCASFPLVEFDCRCSELTA